MVLITVREKEELLKKMPDLHIHRTVKQKSKRHKYYMEERRDAMRQLAMLRGEMHTERGRKNVRSKQKTDRN